jgi:hypothetical protein
MSWKAAGNTDYVKLRSMLNDANVRLVLAFPGTGKTTCVKGLRETGDLDKPPITCDFDLKGLGGSHCDIHKVPKTLAVAGDLVNQMMKDGIIVFSFLNYANLDRVSPSAGNVIVTIPPEQKEDWIKRIKQRGDSESFVKLMDDKYFEWRGDWIRDAETLGKRLNVEIVTLSSNEYLSDALVNHFTDKAKPSSTEADIAQPSIVLESVERKARKYFKEGGKTLLERYLADVHISNDDKNVVRDRVTRESTSEER